MVLNAQRTIYAMDLALANILEDSYVPKVNTTLNEKFNLNPDIKLPTGQFPKLRYFAIGIGGNDFIDNNSTGNYNYSQHNPSDAALFEQIPFVIRLPEDDLTFQEQARYRFRMKKTYGGVEYVCYYLRAIEVMDNRPYFFKITHNEDTDILSVFSTETDKLLNPIPVERNVTLQTVNECEYITKHVKIEFMLTDEDIVELNHVLDVIGATGRNLTEIALCLGGDAVTGLGRDAVSVQIGFHIGVKLDLQLALTTGKPIQRSIEIGGSEPLVMKTT